MELNTVTPLFLFKCPYINKTPPPPSFLSVQCGEPGWAHSVLSYLIALIEKETVWGSYCVAERLVRSKCFQFESVAKVLVKVSSGS